MVTTVNNTIKPLLFDFFRNALESNYGSKEWKLAVDDTDPQTLLFYYPPAFRSAYDDDYILPVVKLEFGARADRMPTQKISITILPKRLWKISIC